MISGSESNYTPINQASDVSSVSSSVPNSTLSKLIAPFKKIPDAYRACVESYNNYTKDATLPEKLIYECINFGKTIGADKAGESFGKCLSTLPSLELPISLKVGNFFAEWSKTLGEASLTMDSKFEAFMKAAGGLGSRISSNLTFTSGKNMEESLQKSFLGKIGLSAAKLLIAAPIKMALQSVKISTEAIARGAYLLLAKSPVVLSKAVLDTADVLGNKSYTEILGRTVALLSASVMTAGFVASHPIALMVGFAAAKTVGPAAALPVGITMAVVEGYFHGEPVGEVIAMGAGLDIKDRKMTNRLAVGACMVAGVACVASGACIKGVSASELFIAGAAGKAVVIGGTAVSALIASPFYHLGEGIVRGAAENGEAPENMFYKDGIMENAKACGEWMKIKLNEFGKPLVDVAAVWKTPGATKEPETPHSA